METDVSEYTTARQASAAKPRRGRGRRAVDVSIILCTRNRRHQLTEGLPQFAELVIPDNWSVELIVVDNGSTDGTRELVEAARLPNMPVRYVFEPLKGKGHAYNAGLAAARGEAFLFTDDDTRVPRDWIEPMCRPILEGEAEAVQGGVRIAPHLDRPWLKGVLRIWVAEVADPHRKPEGLVGANMAFGRKALKAAGPFDITLGPGASGFYDDTTFGWAIEAAGQSILYRPTVAVEHHFDADRLSLKAFMGSAKGMAASRAMVLRRRDPQLPRPTWRELMRRAPGLAFRMLTQAWRYAVGRRPDAGFLSRYYRFRLWRELRSKG